MDIRQLSPTLSVSPQLAIEDLDELKAAGFKTVIINRPDIEVDPIPNSGNIIKACQTRNLETRFIPITPGQISPAEVSQFREALATLPEPAIAYCKSGTRSAYLWAFALAGTLTPEQILNSCQRAGYDLSVLRPQLETL